MYHAGSLLNKIYCLTFNCTAAQPYKVQVGTILGKLIAHCVLFSLSVLTTIFQVNLG